MSIAIGVMKLLACIMIIVIGGAIIGLTIEKLYSWRKRKQVNKEQSKAWLNSKTWLESVTLLAIKRNLSVKSNDSGQTVFIYVPTHPNVRLVCDQQKGIPNAAFVLDSDVSTFDGDELQNCLDELTPLIIYVGSMAIPTEIKS